MLVTREMDYAIRAVRALRRGELLPAVQIAEQENMAPAITYKVLKQMVKAGVAESRRGTDGGYRLCRPCTELTLWDLFRALGEDLLVTACLQPGHRCDNNANGCCGVHREFSRIQRQLETELRQKTLEELLCPAPCPASSEKQLHFKEEVAL